MLSYLITTFLPLMHARKRILDKVKFSAFINLEKTRLGAQQLFITTQRRLPTKQAYQAAFQDATGYAFLFDANSMLPLALKALFCFALTTSSGDGVEKLKNEGFCVSLNIDFKSLT